MMDIATLQAALVGFQSRVDTINGKMAEIRAQLGGKPAKTAVKKAPEGKKRTMSASARKRIAAGQKKRWAEYHAKRGVK